MTVKDDVETGVAGVLGPPWNVRDGTVVPDPEDITLVNGAVKLDATYMYADLADSSTLAQKVSDQVAAKAIRAYLNAAVRIVRHFEGEIRSFDGDRVMAIFVGSGKNTRAVKSGMAINWAVSKVLRPQFDAKWPTLNDLWTLRQAVGIASGEAFLVNAGVRGNRDLVSVGSAPNVAAKLSDLRQGNYQTFITASVYGNMNDSVKYSSRGHTNMWIKRSPIAVGGQSFEIYGSTWWKSP